MIPILGRLNSPTQPVKSHRIPAFVLVLSSMFAPVQSGLRAEKATPTPPSEQAAASATPEQAEVVTGPRNLLHPDYCEIIAAPSDRPAKLLVGDFDLPLDELSASVYGFKNDAAATVTGVRVFINKSDDQALKSLELLTADSPTGPFTVAATVGDTQNLKMFRTKGWQEFTFPPVTMKFFKINAKAHNHPWLRVQNDERVNGLQLIGEMNP
ncbi:MAG: hypothetical protein ACOYOL_05980 [Chthoniobacterales bacterium]